MHYTVDYKGLDRQTKRQKALADAKFHLGVAWYDRVMASLRQEARKMTINRRNIRFLMDSVGMFCGISGYPAKAMVFHAIRNRNA